jgi:undecaprenyl-diphosphatase
MSIVQALILGIVQGATEFIPVSSSGHLVLVPWLLGWPEPGLVFDTIVHWGTLLAILAVFWRDLLALARAWARSLVERNPSGRALRLRSGQASGRSLDQTEARLAWLIIVGTLPAALMGFFLEDFFKSLFSSPG